MNIFTLLAGLAMLIVAAGTLVAIASILWFGRRKPWRTRGLWLLISLLPAAALFFAMQWFFGPADYTSEQDLKEAYHTEFRE